MQLGPLLERVLLDSALHLIGVAVALDLLVADIEVRLHIETAVEIDGGREGRRGVVLIEGASLFSARLVLVQHLVFLLRQSLVGIMHGLRLHLDARELIYRLGWLVTDDRHQDLPLA